MDLSWNAREKSGSPMFQTCSSVFSKQIVHLEVTYGLDTNSFLTASFRMASRRRHPRDVLSDNGISSAGVTDEDLLSAAVGVEGLINPHPLTYMYQPTGLKAWWQ